MLEAETKEECTSAKDDTHKTKGVPKRTLETNPTETVGSRFCTSLKKVFRLKPSVSMQYTAMFAPL